MLDVNESALTPDGARIEASDFDAASEYKVKKNQDRPSMIASIISWSIRWFINSLMVDYAFGVKCISPMRCSLKRKSGLCWRNQ